jgi:hypothetical protein
MSPLRAILGTLFFPFIWLAVRIARRSDPWERYGRDAPLHLYGAGSKRDFAWYFEGESAVQACSLEEVQDWLLGCEYVADRELFQERDVWQHPRTFEQLRRGDCEDHALWAWRKLVELGVDAELVCGQQYSRDDAPGTSTGHVWVMVRQGDQLLVFDTVAKSRDRMLRPLAAVRHEYRPEVGVDAERKRYSYWGYMLTLTGRP